MIIIRSTQFRRAGRDWHGPRRVIVEFLVLGSTLISDHEEMVA